MIDHKESALVQIFQAGSKPMFTIIVAEEIRQHTHSPEAEILDKIQTKVLSPCYSQSLLHLCLEISISSSSQAHATSYSFEISYCTV
jgi:hypothetical protein